MRVRFIRIIRIKTFISFSDVNIISKWHFHKNCKHISLLVFGKRNAFVLCVVCQQTETIAKCTQNNNTGVVSPVKIGKIDIDEIWIPRLLMFRNALESEVRIYFVITNSVLEVSNICFWIFFNSGFSRKTLF